MLLKTGELAKRCGLTVRTLHHYDAIGLLSPSARSDSGYRQYHRDDIARLHQILALRRFGLPLAEIGKVLADPGQHLAAIVAQQIAQLDSQIEQGRKLRNRLARLQEQLAQGEEPGLADWLTTLERMTMYDKYFTPSELERFPLFNADTAIADEWGALVASMRGLMTAGKPPESQEAQELSKRWMAMLLRDTNGDPRLLAKLNVMHLTEPVVQTCSGITTDMLAYVTRAFSETKLALYEKYLSPGEFHFLRENYAKRHCEWPPLLAEIRQLMEDGTAPDAPEMQPLAARWMELFRSYAGDDPQTHAKIRAAHQAEPEFMEGTFVSKELLGYVIQALSKPAQT